MAVLAVPEPTTREERLMSDIDWGDHRFFLMPGVPAAKNSPVQMNLTKCPYTEMHPHQGGKGVVFFADMATAKTYKAHMGIDAAVGSVLDPERLIGMSLAKWGCKVVYHITLEGKVFSRHVTEFTDLDEPIKDGQHRSRGL
jgi:hypothetical protein